MTAKKKIKIVLVDDHQMFLDGIISVLSSNALFEILFVETNPKQALVKIKNNVPDLLISDISMPEMNGIEFIKSVKNNYPDVKILVLSMFENLQSAHNIDGYLLKETSKEILIETIIDIVQNDKKYFGAGQTESNTFNFKKAILTNREKEIIRLITNEYTTDEIAEKLGNCISTVESHRRNIYHKLQVKNTAGLVKMALYLGITN